MNETMLFLLLSLIMFCLGVFLGWLLTVNEFMKSRYYQKYVKAKERARAKRQYDDYMNKHFVARR